MDDKGTDRPSQLSRPSCIHPQQQRSAAGSAARGPACHDLWVLLLSRASMEEEDKKAILHKTGAELRCLATIWDRSQRHTWRPTPQVSWYVQYREDG